MKSIHIDAEHITCPIDYTERTCRACGGLLEWGPDHPHTVLDCLRYLRDELAKLRGDK